VGTPLRDLVAARAPDAVAGEPEHIERSLRTLCNEAAAAWPGVVVAPDDVIAALAAKLAGDDPPALTTAAVSEIHLALGCARGDAAAIAAFDRVPRSCRLRSPASCRPRRSKMSARPCATSSLGDSPRIVDYAGRGRRGLVRSPRRARHHLNPRRGARSSSRGSSTCRSGMSSCR
jgi:hypothetical protein